MSTEPHDPGSELRRGGRCDADGRAFKGSQLQVQIYVNRRRDELNEAVRQALPSLDRECEAIRWVSPLEANAFQELSDAAFLRAVGLENHISDLQTFWPPGGPVWDGLATVTLTSGQTGVVLAEGKSHPAEVTGGGCAAVGDSRIQVEAALNKTRVAFGSTVQPEAWLGAQYQTANRLAHLYWLNDELGISAWFIHLLFFGDVDHIDATEEQLTQALASASTQLGLDEATLERAGHALLPARPRSELIAGTHDGPQVPVS